MERFDLYRCAICGNIVQLMVTGQGNLVCCGKEMEMLEAKNHEDAVFEKHIPIFIQNNDNFEVRVGEVLHPMLNEHYIQFIQAISEDKSFIQTKFLEPNQEPKMFLNSDANCKFAREYCNIHGLWENYYDK